MKPVSTFVSGVSLLSAMLMAGSPALEAAGGDAWQESFARDERQSGGATLRYRLLTPEPAVGGGKLPQ